MNRSLPAKLYRAMRRALAALTDSRRRSAFTRELFFRLAKRFTPVVAVQSGDQRYLISTSDHGVGMTLFMGEDAERRSLQRAQSILDAAGARPSGTTVVDIGAHVGTLSVTALGSFGYEMRERAAIFPVALSDRAGTASFEVAPMNPSDGRIRIAAASAGAYGEESWETIEVPTASFDSFLESGEVSLEDLGLVWIDAQGHEGQILAGAGRLLAGGVPMVIEFWPYGLRRAEGLDSLLETVSSSFGSIVDLDDPQGSPRPAAEISELVAVYDGVSHTDLLLIP
jgi:FkbM family methyltransferase